MRQSRLVSLLAVISLVVLLAASGTALCEDIPVKQPKIEATPASFNFGEVKEGEKPAVKYTLKNTGNADLIIYEAKPSCGCTVANLSSKKLAPGATATLEAVYNSHNASGAIHKTINVSSNDPKTPNISLGITGTVKAEPAPDIMLDAFNAVNLKLAPGKAETRAIRVSNPGQLDLSITEITASQGITARIADVYVEAGKTVKPSLVIKPGETRVLDITIIPNTTGGNFQEVLTIRSNSKRRSSVSFVANGVVGG
ncbi:MAG: DUF1573 domain-containing protein [Nitrospirae bacterium]|nr:DUF1573 domain-containing protein [Nitrospirota bacterium]MBI5695045.1 DUF1573 domain-containing protein [Nitrospirota bacterium]